MKPHVSYNQRPKKIRFRFIQNNIYWPWTITDQELLFHQRKPRIKKMALLLSLLFFSLFSSAILRGKFSYGKGDYVFREHPIQFIAILLFIFSLSALCFYRFLTES